MLKKIIILSVFTVYLFSNGFHLNENLDTFTLPDQFDKIHTINENIKTIIVSFEKGTGSDISKFLIKQDPDYLAKHSAVFIANISDMPTIITKLFAIPKMQSYKHKILLINDDNDQRFVSKEEKSTVYKISNGVIIKIYFISSEEELRKAFEQ